MVVMSSYLNQANKSENPNHQVYIAEGIPPTSFYKEQTPVKQQTLSATQPIAAGHINNTNMPEPYMSPGGYYTNNTGFAMSFPNFTAPPPAQWSTGGNNPPPQNFDAMQYSGLNGAPASAVPNAADVAAQNHQYVAPDHLFNQNNTAYQNAFSANPYMNGNWSYFNNPSSFFFPTGTAGDLNLTWGATTTETQNTFLQDLYKPPPPPTELEKNKLDAIKNDLNNPSFEPNDASKSVESVEQSLSNFSVSSDKDVAVDNSAGTSSMSPQASLQQNGQSKLLSPPVKPQAPTGQSNAPAKPVSWAAVASKPASNKPPAPVVRKPVIKAAPVQTVKQSYSQNGQHSKGSKQQQSGNRWAKQGGGRNNQNDVVAVINDSHLDINNMKITSPLLKKLMGKYNFNPRELALDFKNARFFIIKSYSEDDIFRSIKYSSWTSTEHGNRRLNDAFREQKRSGVRTPMYLLFSVNSSGHFCGVAEMMSEVDLNIETGIWVQDKWKGRFDVRWIYVKDVPNSTLRYIVLENNENKPVTNSRDTQEVMADKGVQVVKIIHNYKAQTSIFDDFAHYEKRQEEDAKMRSKKVPEPFNL